VTPTKRVQWTAGLRFCFILFILSPPPLTRSVRRHSRFMKTRTSLIIVALLPTLIAGCSKHSPTATPSSPKVADLGVVEVSDGGTNRVTRDGRTFVVRSFILKDQKVTIDGKETVLKGQKIALMISTEQTDSHGVTQLSPEQNILASPGQTVGISDGVTSISITPQIKP
jgi:hypothetical protein